MYRAYIWDYCLEQVREGVMDAKYCTVEETRNVFRILIEKCGVEPTFSTSAQTRE
jgi:hypothetical protein